MLDKQLSNKIKGISLLLILGVVILHSYLLEVEHLGWSKPLQSFCSNFFNIAVPTFFVISGYLFFATMPEKVDRGYMKEKLKRRIRSLLVPYLIVGVYFLIIIVVGEIYDFNNADYFKHIRDGNYIRFVGYFLLAPMAFHMWYVRDLMAIVILTPLLNVIYKKIPAIYILGALVLIVTFRVLGFLSWGLFWFTLGALYAVKGKTPFYQIPRGWGIACLAVYTISLALACWGIIPRANGTWYEWILILLGVIGFWKVYDYLPVNRVIEWDITSLTFFIYCFHIPLLSIIKRAIFRGIIPQNDLGAMIVYFLAPTITVLILVFTGKLLKKSLPRFYKVLSGNR